MKKNRADHVPRFSLLLFFLFYFQKTRAFIEEGNLSEKVAIVEEGLDDIDDIENLEDSPRLVFIDEECQNLIVVNDRGEDFIEVLTKRRSRTFYNSL